MGNSFKFNTTSVRSQLMKKIRSVNTEPERILRKAISKLGYRYRLNSAILPGKPDLVFAKQKLVVFVDGEFWHGYQWKTKKPRIKANREYWISKIERNMKRDKLNKKELSTLGYSVLRFWEHQIKKDLRGCVAKVVEHLNKT